MKTSTIASTIAAGVCLLLMEGAQASLIVGYDFDTGLPATGNPNNAGTFTTAATSTHVDISATDFGVGIGLNVNDGRIAGSGDKDAEGNSFGTANKRNFGGAKDVFGSSGSFSSTLATAITKNEYMTFSVTPQNGASFDLTSFTFISYAASGGGGARAADEWALFSSVGGLTTNAIATGQTPTDKVWKPNVVPLGNEFTNISAATEFRLYIYGATNAGPTGSQTAFDKVILNGVATAAVPEPSTSLALAILAGLSSLARRRRQLVA